MKIFVVDSAAKELMSEVRLVKEIVPDCELKSFQSSLEALGAARETEVDVALVSTKMPELEGLDLGLYLKEMYPFVNIIYLSDSRKLCYEALEQHASGYLLKGISMKELSDAIRKVYQGTAMINEDIASKVVRLFSKMAQTNLTISVDEKQSASLRNSEWQIIVQVGSGLSNKEIAAKLNLSEGTVRNSLSNILSKLGLRDRTQLAIWAVQTGAVIRSFDEDET